MNIPTPSCFRVFPPWNSAYEHTLREASRLIRISVLTMQISSCNMDDGSNSQSVGILYLELRTMITLISRSSMTVLFLLPILHGVIWVQAIFSHKWLLTMERMAAEITALAKRKGLRQWSNLFFY